MRADQKEITNWLSKTIGNNSFNIEELRQEASDRKYYRIKADNVSYVLADNFDKTDQSIEFFKPSLLERFYIAISNPIFTYMFFVLGFALIGLELFAIGPGLMAVVGSLLVISSSFPFNEFGINYLGIVVFFISFVTYIFY